MPNSLIFMQFILKKFLYIFEMLSLQYLETMDHGPGTNTFSLIFSSFHHGMEKRRDEQRKGVGVACSNINYSGVGADQYGELAP